MLTHEEKEVLKYAIQWTLEHNLYVGLTLKGHTHTMKEHLKNILHTALFADVESRFYD